MAHTSETLIQWAEKIDNRLGPISGRDADMLSGLLRELAAQLVGIRHGSEQFTAEITALLALPPWKLCDEEVGEVLSDDGAVVLTVDRGCRNDHDASALALWIVMAINTLAGFKMEPGA